MCEKRGGRGYKKIEICNFFSFFFVESVNVPKIEVNPIMYPVGGWIIKAIYYGFHCIAS